MDNLIHNFVKVSVTYQKLGEIESSYALIDSNRCIRVIEISNLKPMDVPRHRLPVFIGTQKDVGRILVRSSKTLIFNRVAKTGSQVRNGFRGRKRSERIICRNLNFFIRLYRRIKHNNSTHAFSSFEVHLLGRNVSKPRDHP